MKIKTRQPIFILVTASIATPLVALAQATQSLKLNVPLGDTTEINLAGEPLYQYLSIWYGFIIGTVGILATVMIMWAGIKWLTSRGNSATIGDAKEKIWSAIIGLLLAFLSFTILYLINPALTVIKTPVLGNLGSGAGTPTGGGNAQSQNGATTPAGGAVPLNQISGEAINSIKIPALGESNSTLQQELGGFGIETLAQRIEIGGNSYVGGASSNFGGSNDTGVGSTETGSISGEVLRNLDSNNDYYMAYRFNYENTPPADLRNMWAVVVNPVNGQAVRARIVDWGPNPYTTNRSIDVSRAVQRDLGVNDGGNLYFRLIRR